MFIRALMEGIMPHLVEGERSMNTVAGFGMKKAKYTHAAMSICGEEVRPTIVCFVVFKSSSLPYVMKILNGIKMSELPKKLLITSFLLDNVDSMDEGDDRSWQARCVIFRDAKPILTKCNRAYHNLPIHHDDSGTLMARSRFIFIDIVFLFQMKKSTSNEYSILLFGNSSWVLRQHRRFSLPTKRYVLGLRNARESVSHLFDLPQHIDGGVVANNPSLTAAITVTGLKAKDRQKLENLRILSLGTGTVRKYLDVCP